MNSRTAVPALLVLTWLGPVEAAPPEGTPVFIQVQGVAPTSVGQNGFITVGDFTEGGAFQWMPTSGVTLVGGGSAFVSRDGKAMVGAMLDSNQKQQPAKWEGGRSWRLLGPLVPNAVHCGGTLGFANATSADGRVVVGGGYIGTRPPEDCTRATAFRWEESTGYTILGSLSGGDSRADAVSADGRVVVGYELALSGPVAFNGAKWVDGREEIIRGPLSPVGRATAVNRDGSLIAGSACTPDLPNQMPNAFAWTAAGGVQCYPVEAPRWVPWIGPLSTHYNVYIRAVSDDGRVMGGGIQFDAAAGEEESVVWFDGEPVFLRDYLRSNGYPDAFEGHFNTGRVTGISADGRTIVGHNGGPFGAINRYGFVIILPELD